MVFKKEIQKLKLNPIITIRLLLILLVFTFAFSSLSCSDDDKNQNKEYPGTTVNLGTHKLMAYSVSKQSKYLVVFESGHGNDHTSWYSTGNSSEIVFISDF